MTTWTNQEVYSTQPSIEYNADVAYNDAATQYNGKTKTVWSNGIMNTSSWGNQTKSTTTWTNQSIS